jgi:hypothetical protein
MAQNPAEGLRSWLIPAFYAAGEAGNRSCGLWGGAADGAETKLAATIREKAVDTSSCSIGSPNATGAQLTQFGEEFGWTIKPNWRNNRFNFTPMTKNRMLVNRHECSDTGLLRYGQVMGVNLTGRQFSVGPLLPCDDEPHSVRSSVVFDVRIRHSPMLSNCPENPTTLWSGTKIASVIVPSAVSTF